MKVGVGLPSMETENMIPVVKLADFSKSFAAEAFEARGVLGATLGAPAGDRPIIELRALAPGGVVIEEVRVFNGIVFGAPGEAVRFENDAAPAIGPPAPVTETVLNVGGQPVGSTGISFALLGAVPATPSIPIQLSLSGLAEVTNMSWFLPSGRVFRINGEVNLTAILSASIQFREIPVSLGSE